MNNQQITEEINKGSQNMPRNQLKWQPKPYGIQYKQC